MTDDDVQPIIIAGMPGIRCEACWGRKTPKAATFTGRACEAVEGGGMQLWHCDPKHPDKATAQERARQWGRTARRPPAGHRPQPGRDARVHRPYHRPPDRVPVTSATPPAQS